jgi:hypothetical protein
MCTTRRVVAAILAPVLLAAPWAATGAGQGDDTSPLQVALRVGESTYRFGGEGLCQHSADGVVDQAPAERWSVRHTEATRSVHLAFWRVREHGDAFTLGLSLSGASHRVSTVRIGSKGEPDGSGRAAFTPSGNGGTFSIDAVAGDGTAISGTISCGRFTPVVEEG